MNTTFTIAGRAAILGLTLVAGLSACGGAAATNVALSTTPAASAPVASSTPVTSNTPVVAATTAAPVAVANGTVLTVDQAKALPDGTVAYKMQDGSLIAVVKGQPFPEAVVADVTAVAKATFPSGIITVKDSPTGYVQQQQAFDSWVGATAQALGGGSIIVVVDGTHYFSPGTQTHGRWMEVTNRYRNAAPNPNEEAAISAASADAARMTPALVVVVTY